VFIFLSNLETMLKLLEASNLVEPQLAQTILPARDLSAIISDDPHR